MLGLMVQVTGTDAATGSEVELVRLESDHYNPEQLVRQCVLQALTGKPQERSKFQKSGVFGSAVECTCPFPVFDGGS